VKDTESLLYDVLGEDAVRTSAWLDLEGVPRSVGEARRFVRAQSPALPEETEDSLLLLSSELVTNAVLHARTAITLGVVVADTAVVVLVNDLDLTLPNQHPYPQREGGWGLGLVAALADGSGMVRHSTGGKTAWFRLLRGEAPYLPDDVAARTDAGRRDS
jgi:two-component sensor histidine kinase